MASRLGATAVSLTIVGLASAAGAANDDRPSERAQNTLSPRSSARVLEARWRGKLAEAAAEAPRQEFPNLPPGELEQRLAEVAARYDFEVESLDILRPAGEAPKVVVSTTDPERVSATTPAILERLDPKERTDDDRTGWAYEGFFFEARDGEGVPFLVVHNFWRGETVGGGQWAREEALLPFATLGVQTP